MNRIAAVMPPTTPPAAPCNRCSRYSPTFWATVVIAFRIISGVTVTSANGTRFSISLTPFNVLSPRVDRSVFSTHAATLRTISVIWATASNPIRPTGTMTLANTASRVSVADSPVPIRLVSRSYSGLNR